MVAPICTQISVLSYYKMTIQNHAKTSPEVSQKTENLTNIGCRIMRKPAHKRPQRPQNLVLSGLGTPQSSSDLLGTPGGQSLFSPRTIFYGQKASKRICPELQNRIEIGLVAEKRSLWNHFSSILGAVTILEHFWTQKTSFFSHFLRFFSYVQTAD